MTAPVQTRRANRRVALSVAGIVAGMIGLAFASVPLYTLFCQVTGYGGTTQRAAGAPGATGERTIAVRFDANVAGGLPWVFEPVEREVVVRLGEERLIHYRARNVSDVAITGTATFNVTPHKAGVHFQKLACFCFTEQRLEPGQTMEFPVSFFVDPELARDAGARDVPAITLSYTFFRAPAEQAPARTTQIRGGADAPAAAALN